MRFTTQEKGFSLIELMVSLSVFSIIMVAGIGTLIKLIDANAKAQALYSAMTNVSFALDSITREVRQGRSIRCLSGQNPGGTPASGPHDCSTSEGNGIAFTRERDNKLIAYVQADQGKLYQYIDGKWFQITSDDTVIEDFAVIVDGSTYGDTKEPSMLLVVRGYVNNGLETDTDFLIQSRVTQRKLDI